MLQAKIKFDMFVKTLIPQWEDQQLNTIFKISSDAATKCGKERTDKKPPMEFINLMINFMIDTLAGNDKPLENLLEYNWETQLGYGQESINIMQKITGEAFGEVIDEKGITRVLFSKFSNNLTDDGIYQTWSNQPDDFFVPTKNDNDKNEKFLKAIAFFMFYSLKNRKEMCISLNMPIFVYDYLLYGKENIESLTDEQLDEQIIKWTNYLKNYNKLNYIQSAITAFIEILNPEITATKKEGIINTINKWIDWQITGNFTEEIPANAEIKTIKKSIIKVIISMLIPDETEEALEILRKTFWGLNGVQTSHYQSDIEKKLISFKKYLEFLQPEDLQKIFNPIITLENIKITYIKEYSTSPEDFQKIKDHVVKFLDENKDDHEKLKLFVHFIAGGSFPNDLKVNIYTKTDVGKPQTCSLTNAVTITNPFQSHTCGKILDINLDSTDQQIRDYETFKESLGVAILPTG